MKYYEYTNNPDLYKNTCWGNLIFTQFTIAQPDHTIIEARNDFSDMFPNMESRLYCDIPDWEKDDLDFLRKEFRLSCIELYVQGEQNIQVCAASSKLVNDKEMEDMKWIKFKPLYAPILTSYYRKVDKDIVRYEK